MVCYHKFQNVLGEYCFTVPSPDIGRAIEGLVRDGVPLDGMDLQGVDLTLCDLRAATLEGANLKGATVDYARVNDANLGNTNLSGVSFKGADCRGTVFNGARFTTVQFEGAKLDMSTFWFCRFPHVQWDLEDLLRYESNRVHELHWALTEGRFNGPESECPLRSFMGVKQTLPYIPPAESFARGIGYGDTPANNPLSARLSLWIDRHLAYRREAILAVRE